MVYALKINSVVGNHIFVMKMSSFNKFVTGMSSSLFEAESDSAKILKKLIQEDEAEIERISQIIKDCDNNEEVEDFFFDNLYYTTCALAFRKKQYNILIRRRLIVNNLLKKSIAKIGIERLLDSCIIKHKILGPDSKYVIDLLSKLYLKEKEYRLERYSYAVDLKFRRQYYNPYNVLPIFDGVSDDTINDLDETIIENLRFRSKDEIKVRQFKHWRDEQLKKPVAPREEEFELIRNPNLKLRIRIIIEALKSLRIKFMFSPLEYKVKYKEAKFRIYNNLPLIIKEHPKPEEQIPLLEYSQMIEDPSQFTYGGMTGAPAKLTLVSESQMDKESKEGECNLISEDQKENVILTTHAEESIAKPITIGSDNWEKLCSSQNYQEYDLMQRWQKYTVLKWTKDDQRETRLLDVSMPTNFIRAQPDSPSCTLFKSYAYTKFDMEIKIQINTNKFHCGALQASFYYGANSDSHYKDRQNVACASQMTHCVIDAASASDGVLKIPYRYYKPLISTRSVEGDYSALDLGRLRVYVLNPLLLPVGDTNTIDVSVFIRFVEPRLHGMISRDLGDLAQAEMFSPSGMKGLVKGVENLLDTVYPDEERDNPTDPTPPNFITPINSSSWCIGDIYPEKLNPLRFQSHGVTPHPPGTIPKEPEMQIDYITQIYGLVNVLTWNTSQLPGTLIKRIPFSPVLGSEDYMQYTVDNGAVRSCPVLPPVSVMAELFGYWRGSLDYKLDFVSTQFHTGRLLIAYVPRIDGLDNPTLDQLTCCDHVILDVRSNKQYQFINRFLSDKPWWPRRSLDDKSAEVNPPGYIYIMVLNPLTATNTVSPQIEINLYMRAAPDFELHIPVAPKIGLSYNTKVIPKPNSSVATYAATYGPPQEQIYVGAWHSVTPQGKKCAMFRYGPGSDHVTQFKPPNGDQTKISTFRRVYRLLGQPGDIKFIDATMQEVDAQYLVLIPPVKALSSTPYWYGAAFNSLKVAGNFAATINFDKDNPGFFKVDFDKMGISGAEGQYSKRTDTIYWESISKVDVEAQMEDERKNVCGNQLCLHPPVNSTQKGRLTFGERISSVKQLIRRYQPYCEVIIPKLNVTQSMSNVRIPLLPQGLDLDLTNDYYNQQRDGLIPILLSGYRFYRGGMRLKVTVSDAGKISSKHLWVQHKCDQALVSLQAETALRQNVSNERFSSGYASYIQNLHTNSVVSVEIPFYLPTQFGLLQRPKLDQKQDAVHYSLGNLYCGLDYLNIDSKVAYNTVLNTYYSLSDDFHCSVFQGFPPVFFLSEFDYAEAQMEEAIEIAEPVNSAKGRSWYDPRIITDKFKSKASNVASNMISSGIESFKASLLSNADFSKLFDLLTAGMDEGKKLIIFSALTNVFHAIINPTLTTIAWSIASFFISLGVLTYSLLNMAYNALKGVVNKFWNMTQSSNKTNKEGRAEAQSDADNVDAAFISTCVVGALCLFGAKNREMPKSIPDFSKYLYEGLPKFTQASNGLFVFFRNNLVMFKRIIDWVMSYLMPETTLSNELTNSSEAVLGYMKQINWCLDAQNENKIQTSLQHQLQVYLCANVAEILLAKLAVSEISKPLPVLTRQLYAIINLRNKLAREFASPPVRYEPFVICLVGPSKIGKSHMISTLISEMIKSINYKSYDELIYVRTPGNAYWNNLNNQVACLFDDYLCLQDPTFGTQQVAELFALKSTAVFNPPKAAIEEKNVRYNPLIVALCTNVAFPKIVGVANDEAFWRRRDILIHAQAKKDYVGVDPRKIDPAVVKKYGHLEFRIYANSTREGFIQENGQVKVLDFGELNSYLAQVHHNYHEAELKQYQRRLSELRTHFPVDTNLNIEDNIEQMNKFINDNFGNHPDFDSSLNNRFLSGQNSTAMNRLIESLKENYVQKPGEIYAANNRSVNSRDAIEQAVYNESMKVIQDAKDDYDKGKITKDEFSTVMLQMSDKIVCKKVVTQAEVHPELITVAEAQAGDEFSVLEGECTCFTHEWLQGDKNTVWIVLPERTAEIGKCGLDCFFARYPKLSEISQGMYKQRFLYTWQKRGRSIDKLPESVRIMFKLTKTVEDKAKEINAEIEEAKTWYQKVVDKIPGLSTVLYFLAQVGLILFGLWSVVKLATGLWVSGVECKADINMAEAKKNYSEACVTDSDNVNKAITKLWTENNVEMTKGVAKMFDCNYEDQMPSSGSSATAAKPKGNPAPIKAFAQSSDGHKNVIYNKILRNTFWLSSEYVDEFGSLKTLNMRCLGLVGRYFILIDHYHNYIMQQLENNNAKIYFITENSKIFVDYSSIKLRFTEQQNTAFILGELPKKIPCFTNIVKFIASAKEHTKLAPSATLAKTIYNTNKNIKEMVVHHFDRVGVQDRLVVSNWDESQTQVDKVYVYPFSEKGACGSVLVNTANVVSPIMGVHIAGLKSGISGYSECLTRESFEHLALEVCSANIDVESQMAKEGFNMLPDTNVLLVGVVSEKMKAKAPRKTRLVPTECFGEITESTMEPAVLHKTDPRISGAFSPLFEGIRNHGLPPKDFPAYELGIAVEDLRDTILACVKPCRMTIGKLTVEDSIVGIPGLDNYDALDMKTSEGFPLSAKRPKGASNKSWLFDLEQREDSTFKLNGINPDLQNILDYKELLRSNNEIPTTIFTACLKDCKLPKEKCTIPGKTRIFSISPVDFTIQQRQYFMDFSVAYQNSRFECEAAIGIDIKSAEVATMINYLLSNSTKLITGDYSKFGDTLMASCVYYVYDIISSWYIYNGDDSLENYKKRKIFCEEVMHAKILADNTVYQCYAGMPSGNPLTVIINSMVNSIYVRVVWLLIMRQNNRPDLYSMKAFHEHARPLFYGDDLIMSIKESVVDLYNAATMAKVFAEYDIKFTDATKSVTIKNYSTIDEIEASFLKHNFYPHPDRFGHWLAKLDDRAAKETCNWTWNTNPDLRECSIVACESMMEELYGHGEKEYNEMRNKVINYWQSKNVVVKIPTWKEMDYRIYGFY